MDSQLRMCCSLTKLYAEHISNISHQTYNDVCIQMTLATSLNVQHKKKKLVEVCFSIHNQFAWLFHSLIWDKNKVKKKIIIVKRRTELARAAIQIKCFELWPPNTLDWTRDRERRRKKLIIVFVFIFISFINDSLSFSFNLNDLRNLSAQLPTVAKQFYRFFSWSSTNSHCYIKKGVLTYYLLCYFFSVGFFCVQQWMFCVQYSWWAENKI